LFHIKNSSKQPIISTSLTFQSLTGTTKLEQIKNNWLCFDEFLICNVHQPNESVSLCCFTVLSLTTLQGSVLAHVG